MSTGEYSGGDSRHLANAKLTWVPLEEQSRQRLLEAVTVNEQGIAVCENPTTGFVLRLAVVRVNDASEASLVPVQKSDEGLIVLLPDDKPSRVGFFIGYQNSDGQQANAVVRLGGYPGRPTIYHDDSLQPAEVLLGLNGIKPLELDEQQFAFQVGLFGRLGFVGSRTRGHFSEFVRPEGGADNWDTRHFVFTPEAMRGLVTDTGEDTFQFLIYDTEPPRPTHLDRGLRELMHGSQSITRGGGTIGLGSEFSTTARTGSTSVHSLQAAIELRLDTLQ